MRVIDAVVDSVCLTLLVFRNPLSSDPPPPGPSFPAVQGLLAAAACFALLTAITPPLFSTSGGNRTFSIMADPSAEPPPTTSARPLHATPAPFSPTAATPARDRRAAPTPAPTRPAAGTPACARPAFTRSDSDRPLTDPRAPTKPSTKPPAIPQLAVDLAFKLHARSIRRRPITPAGVRRIVQIVTLLQALTADYPNFSWHVHVSGHDTKGDVLWLPVFGCRHVLESSAKRVLDMVYRFVESESAMLSGAAFELSGSHGARGRRAAMVAPCGGLDDGEKSAGGSRRARSLVGEERLRSIHGPRTASDCRGGSFVRSASGSAVQRGAPSTALPPTADQGHEDGDEDAEARAAAAAAAIVDNAMEDEIDTDDKLADALIRDAVAGRTFISVAANRMVAAGAAAAATAAAALAATREQAGGGSPSTDNGSSPASAFAAADRASALAAGAEAGRQEEALRRAAVSSWLVGGPCSWR